MEEACDGGFAGFGASLLGVTSGRGWFAAGRRVPEVGRGRDRPARIRGRAPDGNMEQAVDCSYDAYLDGLIVDVR